MAAPQTTLYIDVEYNTDDEGYGTLYIATNDAIGLVTDGKSFEELLENLKDALDACLGDIDTIAEYNLIPSPHIQYRPHTAN